MSNISQLANVPEISFIDHMTLAETEQKLRSEYLAAMKEITGADAELPDAGVPSLMIKAVAYLEYMCLQYIDIKGRMELLKTSTGDALDSIAALPGIYRQESRAATATEKFTLAAERTEAVAIPAGTRVRTQGGLYFNTLDYAEIKPGETSVETMVQAEEPGTGSSGIPIGAIDTLVDPIPYIASVENTSESSGGLDAESDDSLTERTYLAPSKFSCAGPTDAYEYYVREWRSDVRDVQIESSEPGVVEVYVVLQDGKLLNETEQGEIVEYLNGEGIRPFTETVKCELPTEIEYDINLTYHIGRSSQKIARSIQDAVTAAVADFQAWQRILGRDVNPTELIGRLRDAGVKRVELAAPKDIVVGKTELPKAKTVSVTYGGVEDD